MRKTGVWIILIFVLLAGCGERGEDTGKRSPQGEAAEGAAPLLFGVYASDKPSEMLRIFLPILDELQRRLARAGIGVNIKLKGYAGYKEAIEALRNGECDFVRFGPVSYILAKKGNTGIRLLAMEHTAGRRKFKGIFIARNDSPVNTVEDIRGRSFAFGSRYSTIGRYLSQAELVRKKIHAEDFRSFAYLGRHDKVAEGVVKGEYDAGVVKESTFKKYSRNLKSIGDFDNMDKPWVVREGLDEALFDALKAALLAIEDKEVLKFLKKDGFLPVEDKDYDFVRKGMELSADF